jgi:hypothetical protein
MKYPTLSLFLVAVFGGAAGCGEVSSKEEPDAGPDGPPASVPAKVRVLGFDPSGAVSSGLPDPTAIAVFTAPDGTVIQKGVVNAQGEAEAVVPEGSLVQTVQVLPITDPARKRVFIMNFHGIKPGDVVNAGLAPTLPLRRGDATGMTGTFTADANYTHEFETDCGSVTPAATTIALSLYDSCRGAGQVQMLATQRPLVVSRALPPRFRTLQFPFVIGGTFTVTPPPTGWTDMQAFTASSANLPEEITGVRFERSSVLRAGSPKMATVATTIEGDPPAGAVSATMSYPQGIGVRSIVTMNLEKTGFASQRLDAQTEGVATTHAFDATELPLPWVSAVTITPAERKISWTETGTGTPDFQGAATLFSYARDNIMYAVTVYDFAAPSPTRSITLPGLPSDYAELDPAQQTNPVTNNIAAVVHVDQSDVTGYDQARGNGLSMLAAVGASPVFADQPYRRRTSTASFLRQTVTGEGSAATASASELAALFPGFPIPQ